MDAAAPPVQRHRTAIARNSYSAPVKALLRANLISADKGLFDYGCGRGDDVRLLRAAGIPASGFDPFYSPDARKERAYAVNLGFVINVIENPDERIAVLQDAFSLADGVLSVGAMLTSQRAYGEPYKDGYLTSRGTFQTYYTQASLRALVERATNARTVSAAPGVVFVLR